jgi:hypothetical protein
MRPPIHLRFPGPAEGYSAETILSAAAVQLRSQENCNFPQYTEIVRFVLIRCANQSRAFSASCTDAIFPDATSGEAEITTRLTVIILPLFYDHR